MPDRLKHLLSAVWVTLTGLTLAQINALLGFASLVIGICYQLWKWRREARRESPAPVRRLRRD